MSTPVFSTTTTNVTSAQIENLTTVPVILVPAPGAGSAIQVLTANLNLIAATPYVLNGSESLNIQTNGNDWGLQIPVTGFMDQSTNQVFIAPQSGPEEYTNMINQPVVLNNAGVGVDFSGGTSTLVVFVTYLTLTGQ